MPLYWRRRLTRLELTLYGVLIAITIGVFLDRMLDVMELAERSAMEVTVNQINSALVVQLAADRFAGRLTNVKSALERNPFDLARMAPPNFRGEMDAPRLGSLERGNWVFDRSSKELIYLPRLRRGLKTVEPDGAIRFRLTPRDGGSLWLVPVSTYSWMQPKPP